MKLIHPETMKSIENPVGIHGNWTEAKFHTKKKVQREVFPGGIRNKRIRVIRGDKGDKKG